MSRYVFSSLFRSSVPSLPSISHLFVELLRISLYHCSLLPLVSFPHPNHFHPVHLVKLHDPPHSTISTISSTVRRFILPWIFLHHQDTLQALNLSTRLPSDHASSKNPDFVVKLSTYANSRTRHPQCPQKLPLLWSPLSTQSRRRELLQAANYRLQTSRLEDSFGEAT